PPVDAADALWQRVYEARQSWYTRHFGPLPDDILKLGHMMGVWPGGGLFVIPANVVQAGLWCYTTFGFSNPDMPATTTMTNVAVEHDALGRPVSTTGTLQGKPRATAPQGAAGYGYEFVVLAEENAQWPLWLLQWAASAELTNDVGMLARVEKYAGLTISDLAVGRSEPVHILIARARPPLPVGTDLPNGKMELLIATTITRAEMQWSFENGRDKLLDRLVEKGYGQISRLERPSVV
ncbi:MAG TPA: suppressor of fused domain protein, partial [Xanthomonadaceae bacterium]|nr:suppressor of fused domain protein [Xanthomonadaceae bacterium]